MKAINYQRNNVQFLELQENIRNRFKDTLKKIRIDGVSYNISEHYMSSKTFTTSDHDWIQAILINSTAFAHLAIRRENSTYALRSFVSEINQFATAMRITNPNLPTVFYGRIGTYLHAHIFPITKSGIDSAKMWYKKTKASFERECSLSLDSIYWICSRWYRDNIGITGYLWINKGTLDHDDLKILYTKQDDK